MSDRVVVTGGAGFIGSHLCEGLLARGYRVRVLDNLSQGRAEWVPRGAELIEGDITDAAACREALRDSRGVFHAAAMSKAAPSLDQAEFCTRQNVIGTQNVLQAAREAGVRKVVYSASSTCYGMRPPPHREEGEPDPLNPYALSKYVGELYCALFDKLYDLATVRLRYFNVYGPRQPTEGAYALVLGIFLQQWRKGVPLTIHGDGGQRRDFVHVRDVVDANVRAFESEARGVVCNIGSGSNLSIREIADRISDAQVFGSRRPADADETLADISRAREILGWRPTVSFEEGLEELKAENA